MQSADTPRSHAAVRPPKFQGETTPLLLIRPPAAESLGAGPALEAAGYHLRQATSSAEAIRMLRISLPAFVLLDMALPDQDPLTLIAAIQSQAPATTIICLSSDGDVTRAIAALRAGAADVLSLPCDASKLLSALEAARRAQAEDQTDDFADPASFIGSSSTMAKIHDTIGAVAKSNASVFITGESGTGKELAAQAVHARSRRADGPFIALNCGAIPPDLLESEVFGHVKGSFTGAIADKQGAAAAADGGTLFLDEICEMLPALQTKLLRFLQTSSVQPLGAVKPQKIDVRIVCATNRDPLEAVRRGEFREDLFYRLYVVPLHMPPLRDRGQDILEIALHALARFSAEENKEFHGFTPRTEAILLAHDWQGNVRQLLNVIRNVVVLHPGGTITPEMLPAMLQPGLTQLHSRQGQPNLVHNSGNRRALAQTTRLRTLAEIEREAIEDALERHKGSVPKAARELDISASTLYRKLEAWAKAT